MVYVGTLDLAVSEQLQHSMFLKWVTYKYSCNAAFLFSLISKSLQLIPLLHLCLPQAVNTVQQTVLFVQEEEKKDYIFDFIDRMEPQDKVLIFVGKKVKWVSQTET